MELFTMKRHQHETADHLNARINEKLNEVDFSVITDIRDYFGMTATIIANDPALHKRMYLDKVDTYAKAHAAVKADEQATVHSRMVSSAASTSADINAMSTYRRGQNSQNQVAQAQRGAGSGNAHTRNSHYSRGGSRGGFGRGRGGNLGQGQPQQHNDRSSRDRGHGHRGQGPNRSQSAAGAQRSQRCESCGDNNHPRSECWAADKTCYNCGKIGHLAPMCWSTPKSDSAASGVAQSLTGSLGSIVADKSIRAKGGADKRDCEVLAIESLAQIPVKITPLNHELAFYCDMVPDSGAMVTAIPACQAKGIELYHTDVVLRNAGGVELKTLGVFEACIGLQSLSVIDTIFVVQGLSQPLLSRSIMKELGL
ncbi:MAG: hypothetical protein JZU63_02160, partial [Rhodoferax sp.]|nr:hypothetical protein [Rhodoferax sp.]